MDALGTGLLIAAASTLVSGAVAWWLLAGARPEPVPAETAAEALAA